MKKRPKFVRDVWVGYLDTHGFVVFDPSVKNVFSVENDEKIVCLWVESQKGWHHFPVNDCRRRLKGEIDAITDSDKERVATAYWYWKCKSVGAHGKSQQAYEYCVAAIDDEIKTVERETEEWLDRLQAINSGRNPNL